MDRSLSVRALRFSGMPVLALLLLGLVGCQGTMGYLASGVVKEGARVPLASPGEQKGTWQAPDLAVKFRYDVTDNAMNLDGVVQFSGSLTQVFPNLNDFFLQLFFVDERGKVLGSTPLASSGRATTADLLHFSKRMPLPAGTAAMAFGYRGTAYTSGSDAGTDSTPFFDYPMR